MLDDFLELFTDARNKAAILVHHQQAQIILVKEGYGSLFGMDGHGRHRSNAHPGGRLSHRRKHLKRMGAQRDEVDRFRHVMRGEDGSAMREDTGLDTGKTSTELDHPVHRKHLLGHEDRLERILIDNPHSCARPHASAQLRQAPLPEHAEQSRAEELRKASSSIPAAVRSGSPEAHLAQAVLDSRPLVEAEPRAVSPEAQGPCVEKWEIP